MCRSLYSSQYEATGDEAWARKSCSPEILYLLPLHVHYSFTADPTSDPESTDGRALTARAVLFTVSPGVHWGVIGLGGRCV